jgi:hypothetical protein
VKIDPHFNLRVTFRIRLRTVENARVNRQDGLPTHPESFGGFSASAFRYTFGQDDIRLDPISFATFFLQFLSFSRRLSTASLGRRFCSRLTSGASAPRLAADKISLPTGGSAAAQPNARQVNILFGQVARDLKQCGHPRSP